jgi:hypothetical protein
VAVPPATTPTAPMPASACCRFLLRISVSSVPQAKFAYIVRFCGE